MGTVHHMVKIRFDENTGEMRPVNDADCPFKNGLQNICVADNGFNCKHMQDCPAAKQISERHYMMYCGYQNE